MLDINGTLIAMIFSFLVFMALMQRFFYGPLLKIRNERKEYIENNLSKAQDSKEKVTQLHENYKKEILKARLQANNKLNETTQKASEEKAEILNKVSKQLSKELEEAKSESQKQLDESKELLKPHVMNLAKDISAKILGEDIPLSVSPEILDRTLNG